MSALNRPHGHQGESQPMREVLAFLLCTLIWGSTWIGIEFQLGYTPIAWSVALRFGLAALLLFAACAVRGISLKLSLRQHIWCALLGLCLFSGNYVLIYHGSQYLTSGLVAVAFSFMSIVNLVNARIFLGLKIDPVVAASAVMGVLGLALIFSDEISKFSLEDAGLLGLLFCIGSTIVASFGNTVAGAERSKAIPLLAFNGLGMAYGTLFNIVFALMIGDAFVLDPRPSYWIALVLLAMFGTVTAFVVYLWLIERIGVAQAAYVAVLMPLVALAISTVVEGYEWQTSAILGVALVVGGNVMMSRRRAALARQISDTAETQPKTADA